MPTLDMAEIRKAIKAASGELGAKSAVEKLVKSRPEIIQTVLSDKRTCRVYLWEKTPCGPLCLAAGADVEPTLYAMVLCSQQELPGTLTLAAARGRPAYTAKRWIPEADGKTGKTGTRPSALDRRQHADAHPPSVQTRPNPPKGPQIDIGGPGDYGAGTGPVPWGQLCKDVVAGSFVLTNAEQAAAFRAYLKGFPGLGTVKVQAGTGSFSDVSVTWDANAHPSVFLDALGVPPLSLSHDMYSMWSDKPKDPYDNSFAGPFIVPAAHVYWAAACIVATAAANSKTLTQVGHTTWTHLQSKAFAAKKPAKVEGGSGGTIYVRPNGLVFAFPYIKDSYQINDIIKGAGAKWKKDTGWGGTVPPKTWLLLFTSNDLPAAQSLAQALKAKIDATGLLSTVNVETQQGVWMTSPSTAGWVDPMGALAGTASPTGLGIVVHALPGGVYLTGSTYKVKEQLWPLGYVFLKKSTDVSKYGKGVPGAPDSVYQKGGITGAAAMAELVGLSLNGVPVPVTGVAGGFTTTGGTGGTGGTGTASAGTSYVPAAAIEKFEATGQVFKPAEWSKVPSMSAFKALPLWSQVLWIPTQAESTTMFVKVGAEKWAETPGGAVTDPAEFKDAVGWGHVWVGPSASATAASATAATTAPGIHPSAKLEVEKAGYVFNASQWVKLASHADFQAMPIGSYALFSDGHSPGFYKKVSSATWENMNTAANVPATEFSQSTAKMFVSGATLQKTSSVGGQEIQVIGQTNYMPPYSMYTHPAFPLAAIQAAISAGKMQPKLGSNPGGKVILPNGTAWYVKFYDATERVAQEVLALALYRALGVYAAGACGAYLIPPGGTQPQAAVVSLWAPCTAPGKNDWSDNELMQLASQFPVDAWLANYDAIGEGQATKYDNTLRCSGVPDTSPERLIRIDAGGALAYRGTGSLKTEQTGARSWTTNAGLNASAMLDPKQSVTGAASYVKVKDGGTGTLKAINRINEIAKFKDKIADMVKWAGVGTPVNMTGKLVLRIGTLEYWANANLAGSVGGSVGSVGSGSSVGSPSALPASNPWAPLAAWPPPLSPLTAHLPNAWVADVPIDSSKVQKLGGTSPTGKLPGLDVVVKQERPEWKGVQGSNGRPWSANLFSVELAANALYRALGIFAPSQRLMTDLQGNPVLVSPFYPGYTPACKQLDSADVQALAITFPADAWLANWDVVGHDCDNLLKKATAPELSRLLRVDNGSTFMYRAQGKLKEFQPNDVPELVKMTQPGKTHDVHFGVFSAFNQPDNLKAAAHWTVNLLKLTKAPNYLESVLVWAGFGEHDADTMAATLRKRAAYIAGWLSGQPYDWNSAPPSLIPKLVWIKQVVPSVAPSWGAPSTSSGTVEGMPKLWTKAELEKLPKGSVVLSATGTLLVTEDAPYGDLPAKVLYIPGFSPPMGLHTFSDLLEVKDHGFADQIALTEAQVALWGGLGKGAPSAGPAPAPGPTSTKWTLGSIHTITQATDLESLPDGHSVALWHENGTLKGWLVTKVKGQFWLFGHGNPLDLGTWKAPAMHAPLLGVVIETHNTLGAAEKPGGSTSPGWLSADGSIAASAQEQSQSFFTAGGAGSGSGLIGKPVTQADFDAAGLGSIIVHGVTGSQYTKVKGGWQSAASAIVHDGGFAPIISEYIWKEFVPAGPAAPAAAHAAYAVYSPKNLPSNLSLGTIISRLYGNETGIWIKSNGNPVGSPQWQFTPPDEPDTLLTRVAHDSTEVLDALPNNTTLWVGKAGTATTMGYLIKKVSAKTWSTPFGNKQSKTLAGSIGSTTHFWRSHSVEGLVWERLYPSGAKVGLPLGGGLFGGGVYGAVPKGEGPITVLGTVSGLQNMGEIVALIQAFLGGSVPGQTPGQSPQQPVQPKWAEAKDAQSTPKYPFLWGGLHLMLGGAYLADVFNAAVAGPKEMLLVYSVATQKAVYWSPTDQAWVQLAGPTQATQAVTKFLGPGQWVVCAVGQGLEDVSFTEMQEFAASVGAGQAAGAGPASVPAGQASVPPSVDPSWSSAATPHLSWIPIRSGADVAALADQAVIGVYHPDEAPRVYLYQSGSFLRVTAHNGMGGLDQDDSQTPNDITALTQDEVPHRVFLIRVPVIETPPSYATLGKIAQEASVQPPPVVGADLVTGTKERASMFLFKWASTWKAVTPQGSAVFFPGGGALYLVPVQQPAGNTIWLTVLSKNSSDSYRLVRSAGTYLNVTDLKVPKGSMPALDAIQAEFRANNRDQALAWAVKAVSLQGTMPMGAPGAPLKVQPCPIWNLSTGTWGKADVAPLIAKATEAPPGVPSAKVPVTPPKPAVDPALGKVVVAALVTNGSAILLTRSGAAWTLPSVPLGAGEGLEEAGARALKEKLGGAPHGAAYAHISIQATLSTTPPTTTTTTVWVVQGTPAVQQGQYAWVPSEELVFDSAGTVRWEPALDGSVQAPFALSSGQSSILGLWLDRRSEWLDHASKAVGSGIFTKQVFDVLNGPAAAGGLPFQGDWWAFQKGHTLPNPAYRRKRRNPADDLVFFQLIAVDGKQFIEYRSKKTGNLVRVQLGGQLIAKTLDGDPVDVYVEPQPVPDHLEPGAVHVGGGVFRTGSKPILEVEGIQGFKPYLAAMLGVRNPNAATLEKAALLEMAGLPIQKVAGPDVEKQIEAAVAKAKAEWKAAGPGSVSAPLPLAVVGSALISQKQMEYIDKIAGLLKELLGSTPSPSTGTAAQKALKAKIQHAIATDVKAHAADHETAAIYLRYLALARRLGMWGEVLDPGRRVVYRGLAGIPSSGSPSGSFGWTPEGKAQAQSLGIADFWSASVAWIQKQSKDPALQPPSSVVLSTPETYYHHAQFGAVLPPNQWAPVQAALNAPWANVAGFKIRYSEFGFTGTGYGSNTYQAGGNKAKTIGHWTSHDFGAFGQGAFLMRTTADSDPGFVLIPPMTLAGASYENEMEVIHVAMDDKGLGVEVVTHSPADLTKAQLKAFEFVHPAYPPGYLSGIGPHAKVIQNPRRGVPSTSGLHAILFDRSAWSPSSAKRWLTENGKQAGNPRLSAKYLWYVQKGADQFRAGSFEHAEVDEGVREVRGVLR